MVRLAILVAALVAVFHGPVMAQGFLDSLLGPGGLGIWGGQGQFNTQQYYGSSPMSGAPGQQYGGYPDTAAPPPQAQQGYPAPGYGYGQQGLSSDWHMQPPAMVGPQGGQYPEQPQYGPQQQQTYGPPQPQYGPPQAVGPQQQYAPQQAAAPQRPAPRGGAPAPSAPLRPGQYVPNQPPPPAPPQAAESMAENLPSGAVQVTTTTPDGTTVQYYPPYGAQPEPADAVQTPRRPARRPAARQQTQQRTQAQTQQGLQSPQAPATGEAGGVASIAMPKPVEPPQGYDPRAGWDGAVNRAPGRLPR